MTKNNLAKGFCLLLGIIMAFISTIILISYDTFVEYWFISFPILLLGTNIVMFSTYNLLKEEQNI